MTALTDTLMTIGIFLAGVAVRLGSCSESVSS
jgi:hypothetical protein